MRLSNLNISEIIKRGLENYKPSKTFEETWSKQQIKRNFSFRKSYAIPLIALITCMALLTVGFAITRISDKIDYPFVNDSKVIGTWKTVDLVKNIADFKQGDIPQSGDIFLTELAFSKDGKMFSALENGNLAEANTTWTKGKILSKEDKTSSKYAIRDINGKTYLFMQWKSGDYILSGMELYYYVLEKIDSNDYSDYEVTKVREDKIEYPFEENAKMLGSWESVDIVEKIDQFKPGVKSTLVNLYLTNIKVSDNGEIDMVSTSGNFIKEYFSWTGDLIINKREKTASKCTIKEIDGNTYMFYEWKSGDYTDRGMTPYLYVLKKVN